MTSLPGMLLVAASCLFLHVALTPELLIDRQPNTPRFIRLVARSPGLRTSRTGAPAGPAHEPDRRVLALVFVVGTHLLMVKAELQPDQAAGDDARDRSGHRYVTLERDQRRGSPTYVPGETDSRIFAAEWAELLALAAMSRL